MTSERSGVSSAGVLTPLLHAITGAPIGKLISPFLVPRSLSLLPLYIFHSNSRPFLSCRIVCYFCQDV